MAINRTAYNVREHMKKHIATLFDKPKAVTKNSVIYTRSTALDLSAKIFVKDSLGGSGRGANSWLLAHSRGGQRRHKASEKALIANNMMSSRQYSVIARGSGKARKIGKARMGKIIDQLKSKPTKIKQFSPRQGFGRGDMRNQYFIGGKGRASHLQSGVWQRYGSGGRKVKPILLFYKQAKYQKDFRFHTQVMRVLNRDYDREFTNAFVRLTLT
jgi:hypothetical protein